MGGGHVLKKQQITGININTYSNPSSLQIKYTIICKLNAVYFQRKAS